MSPATAPPPAQAPSSSSQSNPSLKAWQRLFQQHQGAPNEGGGGKEERAPRKAKSIGARLGLFARGSQPNLAVRTPGEHKQAMSRMRHMIVTTPIPGDEYQTPMGGTYRSVVWKLLLDIRSVPVAPYLELVSKGKSAAHDKIRNDTFRTLATDQGFKERVKEEMLIRLLEAFVWKYSEQTSVYDFSYVQGMNVLAAPFLYTMPSEIEAFYCFSRFIEVCCPLYVQPTLAGVHKGLQLLDRCLELLDPPLFAHLRSKKLSAEIYAFPSVLTLCACTPPLPEVLQMWDFLLAFGVHFNVLCVVAQLHIMRNELLESPSPMKLLRHFPPLNAREIIKVTVVLARDIPEDLYEELVKHPYHPDSVAGML